MALAPEVEGAGAEQPNRSRGSWKPTGESNVARVRGKYFHGSPNKFDAFDDPAKVTKGGEYPEMVHLAQDKRLAKGFSRGVDNKGQIYTVNIPKNARILDTTRGFTKGKTLGLSSTDIAALKKAFPDKDWDELNRLFVKDANGFVSTDEFNKVAESFGVDPDKLNQSLYSTIFTKDVLKKAGFDGIKYIAEDMPAIAVDHNLAKLVSSVEVKHKPFNPARESPSGYPIWKPQGTSDAPSRRDFLKKITAASVGALVNPDLVVKAADKIVSAPSAATKAVDVKSIVDYIYKKYDERAANVATALKNIKTGTPAEIAALDKANHTPDLLKWVKEAAGDPNLSFDDAVKPMLEVSKDPRFTKVRGVLKMMAEHPSPAVRQYLNKRYGGEVHLQKLIDSANGVKVTDAIGSDRAYMREFERRGWKETDGGRPVEMGFPIATRKKADPIDRDLYHEGVKTIDESLHQLMSNPDKYGGGKYIDAYSAPKMVEGNRGLSAYHNKPLGKYVATYRDSTGKPQAQIVVDSSGKIQAVQVDSSLSRLTQDRAIKHVMDAAIDRFQANSVGYLKADEVDIVDRFVAHTLRRTAEPKIRKYYRVADKTVSAMGVPKNLVRIERYSRKFTVAGETMESGGDYNPNNRRIRINALHDMHPVNVKRIVAHEGSHLKFDVATDSAEFIGILNKVFGNNNPPQNIGGVTEYSNAYWEEYRNNPSESNLVNAVNETLAEVGALRAVSPDFHKVNWKAEAHRALIELNKTKGQPADVIAELHNHVNWTMWNVLYDKMSEVYTKSENKGRRVK